MSTARMDPPPSDTEKDVKVPQHDSDGSSPDVEALHSEGIAPPGAIPGADNNAVSLEREKSILRKLDKRIVPMVMWTYLMNMMDRVNIGNARLFNMEADLGMDPNGGQFQLAVSVLFITYCLFEAPSNMIIKKMKPARYLAGLTLAWGIVATLSALVNNFASLLACRLILGLLEAGFFPGVVLYLSMFYGRRSLALRIALFYGTAALSGAAGGLVAYGISFMNGFNGWNAWRWIILINGLPTLVTGLVIPFVLPNSPETTRFLDEGEKRDLVLIHEAQVGRAKNLTHMVKEDVWDAVRDWTTWTYCIALFPQLIMLYSFVVFLPTIINGLGTWTPAEVQAMTIPVYMFGAIVYVLCAWQSDKTQRRGYFIMGAICSAMVGYGMLYADAGAGVSYAGCFFVSVGIFLSAGISFAWVPVNNPRYGKRAFSTGMHLTIGNSSGVAAPFLFLGNDGFRTGYTISMVLLAFGLVLNIILHLHFKRQNKERDEGKQDYLMEGKTQLELEAMGEKNPQFRFAI
ncbi:hypothetical protein MCOR27_004741 [Pyricularia oryzae]|uniref:Major facilitator superfamily (MFS) profile domain-containing protein n=5 Tax=Pyricularia TaxID=48558 RepID=A0ABQ8NS89_PYRGI|nr:uncharacterized protein MGG_10893 [Pyricularia oryzae 70-15]ELQ32924.1 hypothetical protein OOU_Y34scaffold01014g3 [Pyricularia oryzae Y34]KAH8845037.1 hypothetical protein MCOR01_002291 [Pyricularia oryzae]KAI6301405.1 hypothetical protein MCOR33_003080 [Pyricularia grisea]EHA58131.1 hypothetical protein MGG_10893 [Pyricularia oryzae 70-15]KAH9429120.1 hypothetical protein MCOR02_010530 [Pyricularia oryzae]